MLTATLVLSVAFFVFSSSSISNPTASVFPLAEVNASTTPTFLWNFTANQDAVFSPVLANGFVYVTSENKFGSPITLFCINASSSVQAWNITSQFLTFNVANGYVYVGQAIEENPAATIPVYQGAICCLNADSGNLVWNNSYSTQLGTPIVSGNVVYVDGNNFTVALNALTGTQIWNFSAPQGTRFSGLTLANTSLYAVSASISANLSWSSAVYSLDSSSGKQLWNYTAPGQFSSFVAADQNVYVTSSFQDTRGLSEFINGTVYQGGIQALNASNGSKIWQYIINSTVGEPIVANGKVYTVCSNDNIYAFDASGGGLIWNYSSDLSLGSYLLVNGYLYVGSSTGVYCFNSYNGAVIWRFAANDFGSSAATSPTYGDGVIYVGWSDPGLYSPITQHNFYALQASNGNELWSYRFDSTVISSPEVENGVVYIDASFVNPRSNELNEGPGSLIALKSSVNSLPLPPLPTPEPFYLPLSTTSRAIIVIILSTIIIGSAVFILQKRVRNRKTISPLQSDLPSNLMDP